MSTDVISRVQEIIAADESLKTIYDPPVDGPQDGVYVTLDQSRLHDQIQQGLKHSFPHGLYRHQHAGVDAILSGLNTVVATRTSSGKSLIYSLPVCDSLCRDPDSTALFLYPQKALANDQLINLKNLMQGIPLLEQQLRENGNLACRYDGSVPGTNRKVLRETAQIVLSNPDMLHMGILNHHQGWERFFENLKYVVIDECHEYRGIFGTNVAFVLRRLRQICEIYGSSPQFIGNRSQKPSAHFS